MQKTILIVDDEPGARLMLQYALSKEGHKVITARDGAEALEAFQKERVDLILTDMRMPKMDGMELVAAVKRINPSARIVLMTAFASEEKVEQTLALKASVCLNKPVDMPVLFQTINLLLGNSPYPQST